MASRFYKRFAKRAFDLAIAVPATVALSPVMAGVAVAVRQKLGSPVIFKHTRPGQDGEPFVMLKFRTMTDERGPDGELMPDEVRLTSFGKMLRSTSLDELPELINVIKGEMSLVGPRPLLMAYLERYNDHQRRRHDVKPGITGWAQVRGRNAITHEAKFDLDVWYVDNQSLLLDLRILVETVLTVVKRDGIAAEGSATMPVFMGNETTPPIDASLLN